MSQPFLPSSAQFAGYGLDHQRAAWIRFRTGPDWVSLDFSNAVSFGSVNGGAKNQF
jgi:hypothetical protein